MQTWSRAHLRSKGIDDLTCEGLCELEDEEDGELSPGQRSVLALVRGPGLGTEKRGLLIGLSVSCSHGERKGGRGLDARASFVGERTGLTLSMAGAGRGYYKEESDGAAEDTA